MVELVANRRPAGLMTDVTERGRERSSLAPDERMRMAATCNFVTVNTGLCLHAITPVAGCRMRLIGSSQQTNLHAGDSLSAWPNPRKGRSTCNSHTHIHTQALVRDGPRLVTSHIPPCATANRHLYRASRLIFRRIGPAIWVETEGNPEYRT